MFSSKFFLGYVFSLVHRLRVCYFPILVHVTFFNNYIEELCAVGSWMLDDCRFPHSLAEFSHVYAGSSAPMLGLCKVAIIFIMRWAVDLPWFWVASWMLRLLTSFGCCAELFWPRYDQEQL